MFSVAASVIKEFAQHSKQLGGELALRAYCIPIVDGAHFCHKSHPHIHFIIPAGSFNKDKKQWRKSKGKYLFNAFNLAKVWRARLLEHLTHKLDIQLPASVPKKWVVDCRHVGKGLPALTLYNKRLSRYLYRGVLPDKNIISCTDGQVSFSYQDSQTQVSKIRTLPAAKFIYLILQHVLPKGLRRVRDYGLLRGNCSKLRQQIQLMLAVAGATFPTLLEVKRTVAIRCCPCCHKPMDFLGIRRLDRTTILMFTA